METSSSSKYYCSVCLKEFNFSSRFERHVQSASHQRLKQVLTLHADAEPEVVETTCVRDEADTRAPIEEVTRQNIIYDMEDTDEYEDKIEFDSSEQAVEELVIEQMLEGTVEEEDFSPFKSKIHALAFILLNSPRQIGESNFSFIFFILRQLDSTLPSLSSLKLYKLPGFQSPCKHSTANGVSFYTNSICNILRRCFGNPHIASSLARYPTVPDNTIREIYYGQRWRTDKRFYSPMISLPLGPVFVKDFVTYSCDGRVMLRSISQFVLKEGKSEVFADIIQLRSIEQDSFFIGNHTLVPSSDIICVVQAPTKILFKDDHSTLQRLSAKEYNHFASPYPLKTTSRGVPIIMVPIILYSDDTSGNKSKRWNKFDSWCVKLAGLPNEENQKMSNIFHISSSNKVDCLELAVPMVDELTMLEDEGIIVYDAHEEKEVLVLAPVLCLICDNPRASEIVNHLGPGSRMFCRVCMADRDVSSDIVGDARSREKTIQQMALISSQTTLRDKASLKTQFGVKEEPKSIINVIY